MPEMTDRFEIPLETSAGQRGPGSFGEKLGVAIAVIALLGGGFILGGKILSHDDGVAAASATPRASTAPETPEPTALPTPRVFTVAAAQLPAAPAQQPIGFGGWIRALEDLPVRSAPSAAANQIGALGRGEAAAVHEVPSAVADGITWLQLDAWGTGGSGRGDGVVAANRGSRDLVRRFTATQSPSGAWVTGLVASPDQFLAYGYQQSDPTGASRPFMLVSRDGQRWDRVALAAFGGRLPERVAYGPAGWLAVGIVAPGTGYDQGPGSIWLWRSPDGTQWASLGQIAGSDGYYVSQLVGSRRGYEMVLETGRRASEAAWHSSDGLAWTEGQGFAGGIAAIVASPTGFYAWPWDTTSGGPLGNRSADGLSWLPVTDGPNSGVRGIVAMGDGLLAIDTSPVTGAGRVWMRARAGDDSGWSRLPDLPESSGTAVAALAGDGQRVVVFGWDRATVQPVAWFGDGTRWQRARLPANAFGGAIPTQVASSAAGSLAIGSVPSLQAENPVIWRSSEGGSWSAVHLPELGMVGDATATHCPARPADVIELLVLGAPRAIACFGHAPITVRAWLTPCEGCGGMGPGTSTPAWLLGPDLVGISPIEGQQDIQARLARGLAADPGWQNQQVEITGHYDDPAATSCRYIPDVSPGGFPISRADLLNMCRQAFVITRVQVVPGG